jgi:hypothetical protein
VAKGKSESQKMKMEVGPEDGSGDAGGGVEHVVVVVPVDSDVDEAEDVAEKDRHQRNERLRVGALRNFHLQHHDGDDDGDHSVAECFQASFVHAAPVTVEIMP